jgi:hypothetical protein
MSSQPTASLHDRSGLTTWLSEARHTRCEDGRGAQERFRRSGGGSGPLGRRRPGHRVVETPAGVPNLPTPGFDSWPLLERDAESHIVIRDPAVGHLSADRCRAGAWRQPLRLPEDQRQAVGVLDAELAPAVERCIEVFCKPDIEFLNTAIRDTSRRANLPCSQELVQFLYAIGEEPQ